MAQIKSGASSDLLTVDATSKAARVSIYDTLGNFRGCKATYRATNTGASITVANGTGMFFVLTGSATKTIILQRLVITGPTVAPAVYDTVALQKFSTAPTAGTAVAFTQVPLDSNSAAGTVSLCQGYTAAPTSGTLVGVVSNIRALLQANNVTAAGLPLPIAWDFRNQGENSGIVLRGIAQCIGLNFTTAPGGTVIMCIDVEWTEE